MEPMMPDLRIFHQKAEIFTVYEIFGFLNIGSEFSETLCWLKRIHMQLKVAHRPPGYNLPLWQFISKPYK